MSDGGVTQKTPFLDNGLTPLFLAFWKGTKWTCHHLMWGQKLSNTVCWTWKITLCLSHWKKFWDSFLLSSTKSEHHKGTVTLFSPHVNGVFSSWSGLRLLNYGMSSPKFNYKNFSNSHGCVSIQKIPITLGPLWFKTFLLPKTLRRKVCSDRDLFTELLWTVWSRRCEVDWIFGLF